MAKKIEYQKITPFLWFDDQAEEAARLYTSVFGDSRLIDFTKYTAEGYEYHGKPEGSVMTVDFELEGQRFTALNGGPAFSFTPAVSFFVVCESIEEFNKLWEKLSKDGKIMMEAGKYEWSEKYGWLEDHFGLSWQISMGKYEDVGQKITPAFLFSGEVLGKSQMAIEHYTSIFSNSHIHGVLLYGPGEEQAEGLVRHAQFGLDGFKFMIMDSGMDHSFSFTEAISFSINCKTQDEIDHFWEKLTEGGDPQAQQCGWLKDKFGVSWQVVPDILEKLLKDSDTEKVRRVASAMFPMKKLVISDLVQAYQQRVDVNI